MKNKLLGSVPIALVAMLVLSMIGILPIFAIPTVEVRNTTDTTNLFIFDTATTPVGSTFQVVVWIKNVANLFAFQLNFTYNPAQLLVTVASLPKADPAYVFFADTGPTIPLGPTYNVGNVIIGESLLADPSNPPFTGSGKAAVLTIKIIAPPPKLGFLTSSLDVDKVGVFTTKLKDSGGLEIVFTDVDGTYKYNWSQPATKPYFKVVPQTTTFGPFPPSAVGQTFTVDIKVMQLDSAWGLIRANMTIQFNATLIDFGVPDVTFNPLWGSKIKTITYLPGLDNIKLNVSAPTSTPSGNVLVATLKFVVMYQGVYPAVDTSPLDFIPSDCVLVDDPGPALIPQDHAPENGQVIIKGLSTLPQTWFEVEPATTTLGPDLVVGDQFLKRFDVNVNIRNLTLQHYMVGFQFRLTYDDTLVKVVDWEEGPFLKAFNNTNPPSTFPIAFPHETIPNVNFLFGDINLPNATGRWNVFPFTEVNGRGTVLTITFEPLVQSWVDTYSFDLELYDIKITGIVDPSADPQQIQPILFGPPTNGEVTILPIGAVGRRIDVWMQYPAPYGGQGLDQHADLVVPQQEVILTAKVTYNWWPVAQKKVTFNIYDNNWNLKATLEATSGDDGHASATYRMPWPNVNPESLFGVWHIFATVSVADVTIFDRMDFHYDYLVRIWSVTTDKLEYMHLESVSMTVKYGTHAEQSYTVWMTSVIQDNLGVPVGMALLGKTIGGAVFSVYTNYTSTVSITIPWWAYAGSATVRVNFLDKSPIITGSATAVTPEKTKGIYILPI